LNYSEISENVPRAPAGHQNRPDPRQDQIQVLDHFFFIINIIIIIIKFVFSMQLKSALGNKIAIA
jgi:hypothetical protein